MEDIIKLTKLLEGEIELYINSFVKDEDKKERRKILEDFMLQIKDVGEDLFVVRK